MTQLFPILPGQGWSVHKKPTFASVVASHVSGREVRAALYQNPIWEFELTYDGLASDSISFPGLQSQSLQTLMGFFLQCQGQYASFYFFDPTDYAVSAQAFGVGNGTTTAFQLSRALGGFVESVLVPFTPSPAAPYLLAIPPGPGGTVRYAPNNVYANSVALASALGVTAQTLTSGQADPSGGTLAVSLKETATTSIHDAIQSGIPILAGTPATFSVYLKANGSRYQELILDNSAANGFGAVFDLSAGVVSATFTNGASAPCTATISAAGGGYFRCAVSGVIDSSSTAARASIVGNNNSASGSWYPSYLGSTGNGVYAAFPQVEQTITAGAPTAFNPTLATLYYGGPSITVGGVFVDPSTYTLSNGLVTFSAPPSSAAALAWTGYFLFLCRFLDDSMDFENFMQNLWGVKSVKFRSVRSA